MKNKLSLLSLGVICGILMISQTGLAAEIFNESFDGADTFGDLGWTLTGGGTGSTAGEWTLSTGTSGNPEHYAWGGGSNTTTPVDIVSGTLSTDTGHDIDADDNFELVFDIRDLSPTEHNSSILASLYYVDEGVDVVLGSIEYHDDGIEWGWHDAMGNLTVSATAGSVGKSLMVKFEGGPSSHNGASAQRLGIDNVIVNQFRDEKAKNPTPYDGQGVGDDSRVAMDLAELSWEAPAAFTPDGYRVYFGTEPNALEDNYGLDELTAGIEDIFSIDPTPAGDLDDDTQYYWVVNTYEPNAVSGVPAEIQGDLWTFATTILAPVITADPVDQAASTGEQAELQIEFESATAITDNIWEISTDGGENWVAASGTAALDEASVPQKSTLTINSVSLADEGLYRCSLSNDGGSTVTVSGNAELVVKRRLAYYPFDGNADDFYGVNNGTPMNVDPNRTPDITYTAGVVGTQAVVFNASTESTDPNQSFIELSATAYPNNTIGGGLKSGSICCWVKSSTGSGAIMGNINGTTEEPNQDAWYFRYNSATQFRLFMRDYDQTATNAYANDPNLTDGDWYFVAATWQGGDESRIYIGRLGQDGRLDDAGSYGGNLEFSEWQNPQVIGGYHNRVNGVAGFLPQGAMIDDLQIFNYPLTADEVAGIYNAVNGDLMCTALDGEFDGSEFDINSDCVVNLTDFAIMASKWLNGALSDGSL